MVNVAHLIPLFPFLAFWVNILLGKTLHRASAWISIIASLISMVLSISTAQGFLAGAGSYPLGTWLTFFGQPIAFGVIVDPLTVMMLLVVTVVATLIMIYSVGYMGGDPHFSRYFAYMSLFTASMLGLVLADNLLMLYIFWEGVGLCSYLLIAFWFERPAAARAGLKAFLTTRIGDTGLLLGIFLLFAATGSLSFTDLSKANGPEWMLMAAALLIFSGAVGKSAQFPLHVWLPDAMEGPTAVSALIHAATMVAAGVYLVARCFVLFAAHPVCLEVVAVMGGISALMAASIASVNNDIKKVLAYSTISQLGLMMLGLGVGGYSAGTFHLMTHAFFKALLFLCAGSIIHGVHTQDIRLMGGLFYRMKTTGITFVIGTLAIAGVPPLSGFWSKDEILAQAFGPHPVLFITALLTSFLTAFYMARLMLLVLFGKSRSELQTHESPVTMRFPLVVLSFFALFAGLLGSPWMHHAFQKFLAFQVPYPSEEAPSKFVMGLSIGVSLLGIGLAYSIYILHRRFLPEGIRAQFGWLYRLLMNKYYIDEIYEAVFVQPFLRLCRLSFRFDMAAIDGVVNGIANLVRRAGGILRRLQSGFVQNYLLIQTIGVLIVIMTLLGKLCFQF